MSETLTFLMFLLAPPLAGELVLLVFLSRYTRKHGKRLGWGRVLLVNVLSVLILVTLAFFGGELYYRYVYDTTDSLAYTKVSKQWAERYCSFNHAGFRDNVQYLVEREPGKRRISFLGDSFTAGHGIKSVEDRFPNLLRARHPEWEVHALAKFGHDTAAELGTLQHLRSAGYQFDVVVLVYCLNDVSDLFPEWNAALQDLFAEVNRGGWLRQHSFFFDTLYHRYKATTDPRLKEYYTFVRDGYRGELWDTQQRRLAAIHDFVTSNGGRLLVLSFPFLQLEGDDYAFLSAHKQLDQFWRRLGVPHLDLHSVYAGKSRDEITVNRYDAHPNEHANRLAADRIENFLIEALTPRTESTDRTVSPQSR